MKKDFASLVEESITTTRPGFKSWFDALPHDAQKQLLAVKKRFMSGGYPGTGKRALARAIIAAAKENGWKTAGEQGVIYWLNREE